MVYLQAGLRQPNSLLIRFLCLKFLQETSQKFPKYIDEQKSESYPSRRDDSAGPFNDDNSHSTNVLKQLNCCYGEEKWTASKIMLLWPNMSSHQVNWLLEFMIHSLAIALHEIGPWRSSKTAARSPLSCTKSQLETQGSCTLNAVHACAQIHAPSL